MDQTTINLAKAVIGLHFDALPDEVVHEAKRRLLDSIACAAGAFDYPLTEKMRVLAGRQASEPGARVWFTGAISSVGAAGLANGSMVRYLDLSDTILSKAAGHPSDMIPALVALAEARGADGATLIEAIVAAYEVYGGFCDAVAMQDSAVDQSTMAGIGAAAGASRILGLDEVATANALSLALSANVTLYNVRKGALSDWKALAGPNGAKNGVFAAEMAAEGITGPTAPIDGPLGFKEIVGPFKFADGFGSGTRILNTHLKAYPVCYHGQSAVDAAMGLADVGADRIEKVLVESYAVAVKAMADDPGRWTPQNRETADHSLPFVVGVVLTRGALTSEDYEAARLFDPDLLAFMKKIEVQPENDFTAVYPDQARSRITVRLTDGQERSAETVQPKGHAQNSMSDAELVAKLETLWPAAFPDDGPQKIARAVWTLDRNASAKALVDRLCNMV